MIRRSPTTTNNGQGRVTLPLLPTSPANLSTSHLLRQASLPASLKTFLQPRTFDDRMPIGATSPFLFNPRHGRMGAPPTGNINKGLWTHEEDRHLIMLVREYDGARKIKWTRIANRIGNRVGKQCRERWHNHLRPDIKKDNWSREEELLLVEAHRKVGNKWSKLAKMIPGRSENTIKNHWNSIKRQLLSKLSSPRRIHWTRMGHSVLRDYISSIIDPSYTPPPLSLSPPPSSSEEEQVPTDAYENGGLPSQPTPPAVSYHFQTSIMQYRCPYCYSTLPQARTYWRRSQSSSQLFSHR